MDDETFDYIADNIDYSAEGWNDDELVEIAQYFKGSAALPYRCRYYYCAQSYLDWFNVIPNRDWISPGSPDTNIYLNPTDPDNILLRKLKDFRQKIAKLTSEYQSQDHEA